MTRLSSRSCELLLLVALAASACDGPAGTGRDGGVDGGVRVDGAAAADGGEADDGGFPLSLRVETPDGECADLSVTGRGAAAVRFVVTGRPSSTVAIWADKPACAPEPFEYRELVLDDAGRGSFDLLHPGSSSCADNLLGRWRAWVVDGTRESPKVDVLFSSAACADATDCASAEGYCPPAAPDGPLIPRNELFVLSAAEREQFTLPASWTPYEWGTNYEDYPLHNLWDAFDTGTSVVPLDPDAGPAGWLELDGTGSQNHALLWMGVAALGYALSDDVTQYENAATKCLRLLELDTLQGHMRHEAIGGYTGFWEGGIATMALAGLYAPDGSTSGPALLAAARAWWADHVAVLRRLSMADGQVALLGARMGGEAGTEDSWASLSAAVNLQLIDPRPHDALHPTLAALVTADGQPAAGTGGVPVRWYRPRHVAERWVVLRAIQSGAIVPTPALEPAPPVVQDVYRWTDGGRTFVATPEVTGYRPARFEVSWAPGTVVRVEVGDPGDTPHGGKGPHLPPAPVDIPAGAERILGGAP